MTDVARPFRQIRATFTTSTVRVYQAFSSEIAIPAVERQTFVPPFKRDRMTWIKPSFLWMMYRCGWAEKRGQERVLAIDIRRDGFDWALEHACLSTYEPAIHSNYESWRKSLHEAPVRVQWDPERDIGGRPLANRAIQIGLAGLASQLYVDEWVSRIVDLTEVVRELARDDVNTRTSKCKQLVEAEVPYGIAPEVARRIGCLLSSE